MRLAVSIFISLFIAQVCVAEKVYATAYTSTANQTDTTPCISASGKNICRMYQRGIKIIAVSRDLRKRYPYGSIVIIEGQRYQVEDTMNKRYSRRIDIYFGKEHRKAYRWKNRVVDMQIVKYPTK